MSVEFPFDSVKGRLFHSIQLAQRNAMESMAHERRSPVDSVIHDKASSIHSIQRNVCVAMESKACYVEVSSAARRHGVHGT